MMMRFPTDDVDGDGDDLRDDDDNDKGTKNND